MGWFSRPPFNARTLSKRLGIFWKSRDHNPLEVSDAVTATKQLMQTTQTHNDKMVISGPANSVLLNKIAIEPSPRQLLTKLYSFQPLIDQLDNPQVQHAVFIDNERPDVRTACQLLARKPVSTQVNCYLIALRTELYRKNWLKAFSILDAAAKTPSPKLIHSIAMPFGLVALGFLSCVMCSPHWLIGVPIATFWWVNAYICAQSVANNPFCVEWIPGKPLNRSKIQLEMAHLIVSWYDSRGTVTLENYHYRYSPTLNAKKQRDMDQQVNKYLFDRGIRRREKSNKVPQMYIDYWNGHASHNQWQWVEPDQDPADIRYR